MWELPGGTLTPLYTPPIREHILCHHQDASSQIFYRMYLEFVLKSVKFLSKHELIRTNEKGFKNHFQFRTWN